MDTVEQINLIVALVREVFEQDAVGAYLHGSAVLGGLQPHSDIDVLVVAKRGTTSKEKPTSRCSSQWRCKGTGRCSGLHRQKFWIPFRRMM